MEYCIVAENIGKKYRISHRPTDRYVTLNEKMDYLARALFSRNRKESLKATMKKREDFWALKDVSLGIEPGQTVGIIGRNGAGKSTLLKILCRITEPTTGIARIRGRLTSLLEVGTGFHPDLTGRENIYLNAAILGMKKVDIDAKFDEIVRFSEVEKFIDTPVKYYSSGMYVRLAFSIAAHIESEILILDEVLAIGDRDFQSKCFEKIRSYNRDERTILFVSHNMSLIHEICNTCMLFENGNLVYFGGTDEAIKRYTQT
jgi:lipopolysaccharide transport system ATP-binding protein